MCAGRVAASLVASPRRFNCVLPNAYLLCFLCSRLKAQVLGKKSVGGTFPRENRLFRSKFLYPETNVSASGIYISPLLHCTSKHFNRRFKKVDSVGAAISRHFKAAVAL